MKLMIVLLALLALPVTFAYDLAGPLRPIDLIWYMVAFCVAIILFILHHMSIQNKKRK